MTNNAAFAQALAALSKADASMARFRQDEVRSATLQLIAIASIFAIAAIALVIIEVSMRRSDRGGRGQPAKPVVYSRSSSGKTAAEIQRLRTKFQAQQAERKATQNQPFVFTPPKYDEEYLDGMAKLDNTHE